MNLKEEKITYIYVFHQFKRVVKKKKLEDQAVEALVCSATKEV